MAKRMLQRVQSEKSEAEMVSEQGKAQVKKLETKLQQSDSTDLLAKCARLKNKASLSSPPALPTPVDKDPTCSLTFSSLVLSAFNLIADLKPLNVTTHEPTT